VVRVSAVDETRGGTTRSMIAQPTAGHP
jgi:hypothetical protein